MNGDLIKKKIKFLGYSLAEVARKLEISPQNLNKKLKAKKISMDFIMDISKLLNVEPTYFLNDDEKDPERTNNVRSYQYGKKNKSSQIVGSQVMNESKKLSYLEVENEYLKQKLEDRDKMIRLLEDQVEYLKNKKE